MENIDNFTYLGCKLAKDAYEVHEIKRRIKLAKYDLYYSVLVIIKSQNIDIKTKLCIYELIIRPMLCSERKLLTKVLGAVREEDRWRVRHNKDL